MTRKRTNPDQVLTNAERCKRYREKNIEAYRKEDAMNKRYSRYKLASENPAANKKRLKDKAEKKRLYRLRKKLLSTSAKNAADNNVQTIEQPPSTLEITPTPPVTPTPPQPSPSSTPSSSVVPTSYTAPATPASSFKHKSTRARSLKRAENALPKSPGKKQEVVQKLASNVLKIKLPLVSDKKRGRPLKEMTTEEEEWLSEFFKRPDITRHSPRRKDNVYVGKVDGERKYLQVRYLLWTIKEALNIANGSDIVEGAESFMAKFDKELTFRQIYNFLKKHKEIKWNQDIPHESCTCEVCENTKLFIRGLNSIIKNTSKLPEDEKKIVDKFTCEKTTRTSACMTGDCYRCPKVEISSLLSQPNTESSSESSDDDTSPSVFKYYKWTTIDSKIQKVSCEMDLNDAEDVLVEKVRVLKYHLYVHWEQHKKYNEIKNGLKKSEMLVHVDFAENYENKQQSEIQSAYFGHTSFSLFTACCYTRNVVSNEIDEHSIAIVTEASDHSRIATHCLIQKVVEEVKKKTCHHDDTLTVHLWSDGCASQFRSRYVFHLTTVFPENYRVIRYYNECHHGKGPMDGVGGCVKNVVYRAVLAEKVVINTPKEFADFANYQVKAISVLYMPSSEISNEPDYIKDTSYVDSMCTLQVHMIKSFKTKAGFSYLEFYRIATEEKPFYTHWYRRPGDLIDPCGHTDLPDEFEINETCAACFLDETGSEWICCPLCKQWYTTNVMRSSVLSMFY